MNNRTARKCKWLVAKMSELFPERTYTYKRIKKFVSEMSHLDRGKYLSRITREYK